MAANVNPILAQLGQLMEPVATPPFNPNSPVPPGFPGSAPGQGPAPSPQGTPGRRGILDLLRDPRTAAFLLNFANRASQPLQVGETPTTALTQSLLGGFSGLAMMRQLQAQREAESRREQRATTESQAGVEKTRAQTANIRGETPGARATIAKTQAETERTTADIDRMATELGLKGRKIDLRQQAADTSARLAAVAEGRLNLDAQSARRQAILEENKLEVEKARLRELGRANAAQEELERQSLRVRAAQARASIAKFEAEVSRIKAEVERGGITPELQARLRVSAVNAATGAAMPGETREEFAARQNLALDAADAAIGGTRMPGDPTQPPQGVAQEEEAGKTKRLQRIRELLGGQPQK